jgi:hypothetical protein
MGDLKRSPASQETFPEYVAQLFCYLVSLLGASAAMAAR